MMEDATREHMLQMAIEIANLRVENVKLRAALKPFAITSTLMEGAGDDELFTISTYVKDFRAAAAALKETQNE